MVVRCLLDLDYLVDARRGARRRGRVFLPLGGRSNDATPGVRGSAAGLLAPGLLGRGLVRRFAVVVLSDGYGLALVRLDCLFDGSVRCARLDELNRGVGVDTRLLFAALGELKRQRRRSGLLDRKVPEVGVGLLDRARLADFLLGRGLCGDFARREVAVGCRNGGAAELLFRDDARLLDLLVLDLAVRDVARAVRIFRDVPLDALAVSDAGRQSPPGDSALLDAKELLLTHVLEDCLRALVERNRLLDSFALLDDVGEKPCLAVAREALYRVLDAARRRRKGRLR